MRTPNTLILFDTSDGAAGPRDDFTRLGRAVSSDIRGALSCDAALRFSRSTLASFQVLLANPGLHSAVSAAAPGTSIHIQSGDSAAERIISAFDDAFESGYKHVLLFFGDAANIPLRAIETGFLLLDTFDDAIVLGPSDGQGVYAIGLRHSHTELLRAIAGGGEGTIMNGLAGVSTDESAVYLLQHRHTLTSSDELIRFHDQVIASGDAPQYPALLEVVSRHGAALRGIVE